MLKNWLSRLPEHFRHPSAFWVTLLAMLILSFILKFSTAIQISTERISGEPEEPVVVHDLPWQTLPIEKGDTLTTTFKRAGISEKQVQSLIQLGPMAKSLHDLTPGQTLQIQIDEDNQLQGLKLILPNQTTLYIHAEDEGLKVELIPADLRIQHRLITGAIQTSFYQDAKKQHVPDAIILQLSKLFAYKINFSKTLKKGDQFTILYETYDLPTLKTQGASQQLRNQKYRHLLAAEFTHGGETYQVIRYEDQLGNISYYTPEGNSLEQRFLRIPLHYTRISAGFSLHRKHPILHIVRKHLGVDFVAPKGTPVMAAADGVVSYVGYHGGYGRMIILSHGAGYTTRYAHLSAYQAKLKKGRLIKRGQVVGYVGSSGLATGPHLHYEFRIHDHAQNPMTVKIPEGQSISLKEKSAFLTYSKTILAELHPASSKKTK